MIVDSLTLNFKGTLWFGESNEFNWSHSALMKQLEETMLSVGSRFSKIDHSSVPCHNFTLVGNSLAIALHIQLLDMRGKFA